MITEIRSGGVSLAMVAEAVETEWFPTREKSGSSAP
jgi:hypothetical protein